MKYLAAGFQIPGDNGVPQTVPIPSGIPAGLQGGLQTSGKNVLTLGLNLLFYGAVILAVVMVIYSGIEWIISKGDPVRIQAAKSRLLYSIIGLVVVSMAFLIFNVLAGVLGKTTGQLLSF